VYQKASQLELIVARGRDRSIGLAGKVPWWGLLPADRDQFVNQTTGNITIVTSSTYLSIPRDFRPLANRINLVVSRNQDFTDEGPNVIMAKTREEALEIAYPIAQTEVKRIFIIGGPFLYDWALQLPELKTIHLTQVDIVVPEADAHFPTGKNDLDPHQWALYKTHEARRGPDLEKPEEYAVAKNKLGYAFLELRRIDKDWQPTQTYVNPNNAKTEAYREELVRCQDSGQCPFCEGGRTLSQQNILEQTTNWYLAESRFPYQGTRYQALIFPKRHLSWIDEMHVGDWVEFQQLFVLYARSRMIEGGALFVREGNTDQTGATVGHLHWNYTVPEVTNGTARLVQVAFGPWPKDNTAP
jgi:dihydrofolate reductase